VDVVVATRLLRGGDEVGVVGPRQPTCADMVTGLCDALSIWFFYYFKTVCRGLTLAYDTPLP
jgi:hypothetical protein